MSIAEDMTAKERKEHPVYSGVLKYFPDALLEVAHLSKVGNDQHNPGEPLHWAKEKSTDEGDALVRHQLDAGTRDKDGERHSAKVAWRALAQLQREIDAERKEIEEQAEKSVIPEAVYIRPSGMPDLTGVDWNGNNDAVPDEPRRYIPRGRSGG